MTQDIPTRPIDPAQDLPAVEAISRTVAPMLAPGEEILFIVAEDTAAMAVKRDSVVITTDRIIAFRPSETGPASFHDHPWQDVLDIRMEEGMLSTEMVIDTPAGVQHVGWIPMNQADRLYAIARRMEQESRQRRRSRTLDEAWALRDSRARPRSPRPSRS